MTETTGESQTAPESTAPLNTAPVNTAPVSTGPDTLPGGGASTSSAAGAAGSGDESQLSASTATGESTPPSPPRVRIGTQRPGSKKVFAQPQVKPLSVQTPSAHRPRTDHPPQDQADGEEESSPSSLARDVAGEITRTSSGKVQVPNVRRELPPELQQELDDALGGMSIDEIIDGGGSGVAMGGSSAADPAGELEPETKVRATVLAIQRGDVFIDLGGRNQGVLSVTLFDEPPAVGGALDVVVTGFNRDDGLYNLSLPGGATQVEDWSQISPGILVDARITGHNKGGLECTVNNLRGFIPAGQISLYRVEDLAQFVGQSMVCLVSEARPERRNLILSRRAVLEREKQEAKEKMLAELAPGQVREGVVRRLHDFGAFVDLGGVDGLLHVSQMSWARVKHPSEILQEGQKVTVKIQKIDPDTHKISLAMKELTESPWTGAARKYPVRTRVTGTVSKIMDFGAFVQLEPGVEGLVHISELAHQRVFRVSDIVQEGQEVEAIVQNVDEEKQRISLSMKSAQARPEPKKAEPEPAMEIEEATPAAQSRKPSKPLKGGLGRSGGGDQFGLNW